MPSTKPTIVIRTNQDLINKFAEICEEENRSMSNMGEYLIKRFIKEYESKQERAEQKDKLEKSSISKIG